jgi:ferric-dicitrate binding protein FerR (iron transport regulator)
MLRKTAMAAAFSLFLFPVGLLAGPKQTLPAGSQPAGIISAILSNASLLRPSAADPKADYGTQIAWADTIRTDGNGRVRVKLTNSTVSLGANSELMFADRNAQRTSLSLSYGQVRVQPSATEAMEVRTPIAVIHGNGSDFAIDASVPNRVQLVCLEGTTRIASVDSTDSTECDAGEMVIVKAGKAPYPPQAADATTLGVWRNTTDPEQQPPVQYFP